MSSRAATNPTLSQALPLVTLRISNGALASAPNLPNRLKLLNWGENSSVKGPVKLGEMTAKVLSLNQQAMGLDKVALDYEHNTVPGSPEYERTKEPRPVAAYGVPRVVPGEGLFLENIEWTPSGKAEAFNYVDLSPAVHCNDANEVQFIHSVALTRAGAVDGLSFYNTSVLATLKDQNKTMDPNLVLSVAELATALGLQATATKADVLGKLTALAALGPIAAQMKDGKLTILSAVEEKVTSLAEVIAKFPKPELLILSATTGADGKEIKQLSTTELVALSTEVKGLKAELATLTAATSGAEKSKVISLFAADGKCPLGDDGKPMPLDALSALSLPELKRLHANTPVTVPLNARGARAKEGRGTDDPNLKGAARAAQEWAHLEK